jgi:putative membrane protein
LVGVGLGFGISFIPGFSNNNLSMLLITYGLISTNYHLAVAIVAAEISSSFFGFLSPMIFGIGNEATALIIDPVFSGLTEESFKRGMSIVISGGLVGILISLPLLFFAEKIYPVVYSSLKPLVGWILLFLCIYMVWIEVGWKKKIFAATIFSLTGLLGLLVKNSGLISSEYLLLPVFIGLYGFSSIILKRNEKFDLIQDIGWFEKARIAAIAFITSMFASLIPGMKRGQTSALALQTGGIFKREEVLFMLPAISLAFATLSIFILGSTGKIRSSLAYDIQEVMGELNFSQTILFAGSVAISASVSACILVLLAKPLGKLLSRANKKYLKILGFCIGMVLITNFTGIWGIVLAFTATCMGILSSRLHIRSTHLMGVLLLPSIVGMIL